MKELKEIRVTGNVLILDNNRVVSPIIPQGYKDLDNDILVKGEAVIEGAVYTRRMTVEGGPLSVNGAFFVKENVRTSGENVGGMTFKKAVACCGTLEFCDSSRKHFGADVNGGRVCLKNAVVAANVFAAEIVLENCVVLGGVFGTKQITLKNTVVGTFNSPSVVIEGDIYMLYPSCFSIEPMTVREGARLFNLTLADWGSLIKGLPERPMTGCVEIDPNADEQKITLTDKDGNVSLWETYSVSGKVLATDMLDMKRLDNHFLLSAGSLGEQTVRQYEFGCDKNGKPIKVSLEKLGMFFSDIQAGRIRVQPLDGKVSFSDLKKFYTDQN